MLEQGTSVQPLAEWLVAGKGLPKGVSKVAGFLGKMWQTYGDNLVPSNSPLMPFATHPCFFWITQVMDLHHWQKFGYSTFADLLEKGQFISWSSVKTKIGNVTVVSV